MRATTRSPDLRYCTTPSRRAKRVKSRPRPTLRPAWMRVPTWRTRIVPAFTRWPPKTLTPRRWPLLSRPLRELPCPFLCAISRVTSDSKGWTDSARLGRAPQELRPAARAFGACWSWLRLDSVDPDLGVGLPVTVLAPVALAPLHLEGN